MLKAVLTLNELDTDVFDSPNPGEAPRVYDSQVIVPDAHLLFHGEFKRAGTKDLQIVGEDGQSFFIPDYFAADKRAHLMSPEGATLSPRVVEALAGPLAPGQYAQAGTQPASTQPVIGRVDALTGSATVVRNGVTVSLNIGDNVRQGDVVQTSGSSSVAIVLADGSTFSLSANARMVLDNLVYAAGGASNSALISLVQGTFSFVAGQVAKTGDMRVETPVATMGIRGTAVLVEISASDGQTRFSVMIEPDGSTGAFNLYNKTTGTLIGTVNNSQVGWVVSPAGPLQVVAQQVQKTPGELQQELGIVQQIFTIFNNNQQNPFVPPQDRGDVPDANPQTAQGGGGSGGPLTTTGTENSFADLINVVSNNPSLPPTSVEVPLPDNPSTPIDPSAPPPPIITVTVTPNQPPVAVDDPDGTPGGGNPLPNDSDPEGGIIVVQSAQHIDPAENVPTGPVITVDEDGEQIEGTYGTLLLSADGSYSFLPHGPTFDQLAEGESAVDKFRYTISDPFGATASAILTVNLTGVNDAPVISGTVTGEAVEDGESVTLDALEKASDVDAGTTLSIDVPDGASLPPGVTFNSEAGTFTLDPSHEAYQSLAAGETKTVTVNYGVSDGKATTPASVSWTVTGTNDGPVAHDDVLGGGHGGGDRIGFYDMTVGEGSVSQVAPIEAAGFTAINISDLSAEELAGIDVLVVQNPDNSNFGAEYLAQLQVINQAVANGLVLVIHDRFVTDAESILPGSDGFVIERDFADDANIELLDDAHLIALINGRIVSDTSLDGGNSSSHGFAIAGTLPAGADLILSQGDLSHIVTFSYAFGHGQVFYSSIPLDHYLSNSGTANVNAGMQAYAANLIKHAADSSGPLTDQETPVTIAAARLLANDTDVDADTLTIVSVSETSAMGATVTLRADGSITYNASNILGLADGETASDSFTYTIADASGATDTATVSFRIIGTNDAPVVSGPVTGAAIEGGALVSLDALANASDADDDTLTVVGLPDELPAGVSFDHMAQRFTLDPGHAAYQALVAGETETVEVHYSVFDGTDTIPASVSWTVTGTNDGPVAGDVVLEANVLGNGGFEALPNFEGWTVDLNTAGLASIAFADAVIDRSGTIFEGDEAVAVLSFSGRVPVAGGTGSGPSITSDVFAGYAGSSIQFVYQLSSGNNSGSSDLGTVTGRIIDANTGAILQEIENQAPLGQSTGMQTVNVELEYTGEFQIEFEVGSIDSTQHFVVGARLDLGFAGIIQNGVLEDTVFIFDQSEFLANAFDAQDDAISLNSVAATSTLGAAIVLNQDGTVTYDPTAAAAIQALSAGETFVDTFAFTLRDAHGAISGEATASVTVIGIDDPQPPQFNFEGAQTVELGFGTTLMGLTVADADASAEEVFNITAIAQHGALSMANQDQNLFDEDVSPSGVEFHATLAQINAALQQGITYTDPASAAGLIDTITLTVTDENGGSDSVNLIFNVFGDESMPLNGTAGKDVLFTTGFDDHLTGGGGNDIFLFTPEHGSQHDTIVDFVQGEDRIALYGFFDDFDALAASGAFANPNVIHLGYNHEITLQNFGAPVTALNPNDFIFQNAVLYA